MATVDLVLPHRPRNRVVARFMRHKLAVLGLIIVTVLILASIAGPWLIPYDQLLSICGRATLPL